ncbi:MAG: tetratricopeptide repeat protein [Planctomycetes bacterium]|nr:tetratricopeptide repeat protein [Planctomycetota bacterium]
MTSTTAFVLFSAVGALSSLIAANANPIRTSKAYLVAHIMASLYLTGAIWKDFSASADMLSVMVEVLSKVALCIVGLMFHAYFIAFAIRHHLLDVLPTVLMGDDRLRMPKTYDRAEKAERARDFAQAAQLYREAVAQDPKDLEARRRLAEVHVQLGDYDAAIRELTAALAETAELDLRGPLVVRLAEILVQHRNDRMAALERLYKFKDEAAGTRHAEYVQARIEALTK